MSALTGRRKCNLSGSKRVAPCGMIRKTGSHKNQFCILAGSSHSCSCHVTAKRTEQASPNTDGPHTETAGCTDRAYVISRNYRHFTVSALFTTNEMRSVKHPPSVCGRPQGNIQNVHCVGPGMRADAGWRRLRYLQSTASGVPLITTDDLIPELTNTAHSCSQYDPATAWLQVGMASQRYTCFKNIYSVGSTNTLSIPIKSLLLRLGIVCSILLKSKNIRNCRAPRGMRQCFWNGEKMFGAAYAVLRP